VHTACRWTAYTGYNYAFDICKDVSNHYWFYMVLCTTFAFMWNLTNTVKQRIFKNKYFV